MKELKVLTAEQVQALIDKRNKEFKKLSKAKKRVAIAEDVIDQIRLKKFEVQSGSWIDVITANPWDARLLEEMKDESLQAKALSNEVKCRGCALGGLMLSSTLYNNEATIRDMNSVDVGSLIQEEEDLPGGLNSFFSKEQLQLIENAFERGRGGFRHLMDDEAVDFYYEDGILMGVYDAFETCDNRGRYKRKKITKLTKRQAAYYNAVRFGFKYDEDEKRLIAIMKNIIKNSGTFIPPTAKVKFFESLDV